MGKSAPKAPDPYKTAAAQTQSNIGTAAAQQNLNMINQVGPQGSLTYEQIGTNPDGTPRYQQTTSLNPQAQAAYDAYQSNLTNVNNAANQALAQLGGMQLQSGVSGLYNADFAGGTDYSADRQRVEDALWQRGAAERASQEANLRSTLAAKGIREGTAAWNSEMQRLAAQNTDAQLATIAAAGQEQSRLIGLDREGQSLTNTADLARMQAANDAYGQQANVMGGLFGLGSGAAQMPTFNATPQVAVGATDLAGLVGQNYANQVSAYNAKLGAIGGLAGTAAQMFMASDRRLKTDIKRVGTTDAGTPIYTYRYITGGPVMMGVMAQDVPHAAHHHESGFLMVDYSEVN